MAIANAPPNQEGLRRILDLIDAGVRTRQSQFLTCRYCGRRIPPEHAYDRHTCDGCAEKHLGVIH